MSLHIINFHNQRKDNSNEKTSLIKKALAFLICIVTVLSVISLPASALTPCYTPSNQYKSSVYYQRLCNVSLTGNQRTDVINVAKSQLGYRGSKTGNLSGTCSASSRGDYTEYGRVIGSNPNQWCAYFVSFCCRNAGISTSIIKNSACAGHGKNYFNIPYYAGGGQASDGGEFKGKYYTPRSGDLFFTTSWSHVGFVYTVNSSNGTFTTIEGNTSSDLVSSNTYKIKDYYFGVPNYKTTSSTKKTTTQNKIYASSLGISSKNYIEFKSWKTIACYRDILCTQRGSGKYSYTYNASVSVGDVCKIVSYNAVCNSFLIYYPINGTYYKAYIKATDILPQTNALKRTVTGTISVYYKTNTSRYGYTESGDTLYYFGKYNSYGVIIYTARSGNRAYKMGLSKISQINSYSY